MNKVWHHGRTVLLGDAAHTAHFSIGSGTKLAMEDSIALRDALERRAWDVDAALVDYELGRQPVVERTQQAASESAAYFARRELSRPGADPVRLQPAHAERQDQPREPRRPRPDVHARPRRLVHGHRGSGRTSSGVRSLRTTRTDAAKPRGRPAGRLACRRRARAQRSRRRLRRGPDHAGDADDRGMGAGRTAVLLQLGHAGRRGACRPRSFGVDVPLSEGWELVSASAIPYGPFGAVPRSSTSKAWRRCARFVAAAKRAAELGVDVLELDLAHGYLLASFLSPLSNRRSDAYGDDRLRFPLEVVDAVRSTWDGVLAVRLSVTDWASSGVSVEDGIGTARALVEHGCDLVHTVAGQTVAEDRPEYRRGFLTALSDRVRTDARVPTLVGGHLTTLDDANTIVGAGRGDLCILDLPPSDLERELLPVPEHERAAAFS